MEEVVNSVKRVTDIMSEIMVASLEQTSGIEQVNQAIIQMDQVTQQNAALVEQAAAAAQSMQDQADNLLQVVGVFRLDDANPAALAVAPLVRNNNPVQPKPRPASIIALPKARRPARETDWEEF